MAQELGPAFKELVGPAYYVPMADTHATSSAIFNRLDPNGELTMHKSQERARPAAQAMVMLAHKLVILNLQLQGFRFEDVEEKLQPLFPKLVQDLEYAWRG